MPEIETSLNLRYFRGNVRYVLKGNWFVYDKLKNFLRKPYYDGPVVEILLEELFVLKNSGTLNEHFTGLVYATGLLDEVVTAGGTVPVEKVAEMLLWDDVALAFERTARVNILNILEKVGKNNKKATEAMMKFLQKIPYIDYSSDDNFAAQLCQSEIRNAKRVLFNIS